MSGGKRPLRLPEQSVCRQRGLGLEMSHLSESVGAGVRAACADEANRLFEQDVQDFFERVLHGAAALLALPADEVSAVVFDY